MSDFNKYSQGNQRLQAELPTGAETTVRGSQLQRRNQSTFNPLEFNPNPQTSNDEMSKQRKKELQQQYRDQLDQMVAGNAVRKSSAKQVTEDYNRPYIGDSGKYQQPSNVEYERYQQGHHDQNENYNRQAYGQVPSSQGYGYGQSETQVPTQSQNQRYRQQTPTHNPINWQPQDAKQSREQPLTYSRSSEDKNSFAQQDELREQLLAKIRTGNVHPNSNVYNSYQRAHEEREKHMKEFERNVVDKAAQEKMIREDQKAMTEWEKKKKLAWETNSANKRALEEKAAQKRRQQYDDMEADNRRVQDSLAQFERQEQAERERKKKLREENSKVLEQQRKEYIHRNNRLFGDDIVVPGQALTTNQRYGHGLSPEKNQREKQPLETRHQGQYNYHGEQDALTSAMENLNMKGYQGNEDYDQKYYQDQAYQQYARELAEREAPSQQYQDAPYQYQREQDAPEKYSRGKEPQSQHEIRQESPYSPQKQSSAKSDYLKIREKARYGNNFNIISNEYK